MYSIRKRRVNTCLAAGRHFPYFFVKIMHQVGVTRLRPVSHLVLSVLLHSSEVLSSLEMARVVLQATHTCGARSGTFFEVTFVMLNLDIESRNRNPNSGFKHL